MKKLVNWLCILFWFTASMMVNADEVKQASDNSYFTLGTMNVSASDSGPLRSTDVLTSVDILGGDLVENENVDNAWELFRRLPGVTITDFGQANVSGEFSFRGFNGEGEINAMKLLIDGIPSNSTSGNMEFLDIVFPMDIESIEVVRGTNDPRYGLHNIAGNANIATSVGGNYKQARISYGSFDTLDFQAAAGIDNGSFSQNYFVAYRDLDGYRDHANHDKFTFAGKWLYSPQSDRYSIGLIARWYESEADSPGYLFQDEARNTPTRSPDFNKTDGGKREIGQFSGHLDMELTPELFWSMKSYFNTFDRTRWVKFDVALSQHERISDELQYGALTTLTYRPQVSWLDDFVLEGGLDVQQQDNESTRYIAVDRVREYLSRNQDFDFLIYGGFLQAIIKPVAWLKLVPGFRIDSADGDFTNLITDIKLPLNDYDFIWQPKFSAVITPFEGYSLYGNWGRTFQVGIGAGAFKNRVDGPVLEPSINDG